MNVAATGWFTVGFAPMTIATSASATSSTWFDTAPEPTSSSSAATDDAWHSRVQWSTLFVRKPVRTSFWNKYASSLRPLRRSEPGERGRSVSVADVAQREARLVERLVPRRFAEVAVHVVGVDQRRGLRRVVPADQRLRQALGIVHVVEAEASLDAQPARVRRPVAPIDRQNLFVLDVVRQEAADAAVRARRLDLGVGLDRRGAVGQRDQAPVGHAWSTRRTTRTCSRPSGRRSRTRSSRARRATRSR